MNLILTAVRDLCADMVAPPMDVTPFEVGDIVTSKSGNRYKLVRVRKSNGSVPSPEFEKLAGGAYQVDGKAIAGCGGETRMNFETARDIETLWKSRELLAVSCQLVEAGLRCLESGVPYFGPDDIPEGFTADGQGLTGSAVHMLRSAGIIADYYGSHPEAGLAHGRRKSKRESANGRKVCTYSIVGRGLAEAFLKRNGAHLEPLQRELVLA